MKEHFFVPVIAHNMRGYDSHLIIKHMEKKFTCADISVIASNTEKFISFQIGQLRFLDSLQCLNASLIWREMVRNSSTLHVILSTLRLSRE